MTDSTWADPYNRPGYQRARLRDVPLSLACMLWAILFHGDPA